MQADQHTERVHKEMRDAGVGRFGFLKFGIRYLPKVIHPDEHVHGIVYGRYREDPHGMTMVEGLLVATDRRVLFVDHKPGYTKVDELTYDIVSGVEGTKAGPFTAVTLHTRLGDFLLRFAKAACVKKFVEYVETRRLESIEQALKND